MRLLLIVLLCIEAVLIASGILLSLYVLVLKVYYFWGDFWRDFWESELTSRRSCVTQRNVGN